MAGIEAVRKASEVFYAALNSMANGDARPMGAAWSHTSAATTMHPIGGRESGWNKVKGPWQVVASLCTGGRITLTRQQIQVGGNMAVESGVEKGRLVLAGKKVSVEARVTNVYRRTGRSWKIVHHHTDLSPDMIAILQRLQAKKK